MIQQAQESIFRPLQMVSGVIPDEIKAIAEGFRSYVIVIRCLFQSIILLDRDVTRQLESMKSLQQRSLVSRVISTSDIAEEINKLRTRIQGAITNFNVLSFAIVLIDSGAIDHHCIDSSDSFESPSHDPFIDRLYVHMIPFQTCT